MALTQIDDRGLKTPIDLQDNEKIRFGTGNDLEIYHDGSGSAILNAAGSGQLTIASDNALNLASRTGTEYFFRGYTNGAAELYYDNSKKIETTSAGTTTSGVSTTTDGNGSVNIGGNYLLLERTSGTTNYLNAPNADAELYISADETIRFGTVHTGDFNSTERMRIDSSGNVGIGEATPLAQLHIKPATNKSQLLLEQNNAVDGYALFQDGPNGGHLKFMRHVNGTETQKLLLRNDGGLCFGTDTAAANALDDYEEGSFSPTVASGGTVSSYTHQYGYYIKIGRIVYWQIYMAINGSGSSGGFTLGSFPFTSGAYNSTGYGGATVGYANNTFQTDNMYLYQEQNSTTLIFRNRAGQAIAGNSGAIFANADFILFGQYITA